MARLGAEGCCDEPTEFGGERTMTQPRKKATITTTKGAREAVPNIEELVAQVSELAAQHDTDIQLEGLWIEVVKRRRDSELYGWCLGTSHVKLFVRARDRRIAWRLAHELRHAAQCTRGEVGELISGMSPYWGDNTPYKRRPEESDADSFADKLCLHLP